MPLLVTDSAYKLTLLELRHIVVYKHVSDGTLAAVGVYYTHLNLRPWSNGSSDKIPKEIMIVMYLWMCLWLNL